MSEPLHLQRAAEVVEDTFLATRQGKCRNDWVTGEEVAADLDRAGLLVTAEVDNLVRAARKFRNVLIPGTSTAPWAETDELVKAIDRLDCEHPRAQRAFHMDGRRECARCGAELPAEEPTPEPEPSVPS